MFCLQVLLGTVANKCHGKRKKPPVKEKCSRQKRYSSRQKKKTRGKRKALAAQKKQVTAKENIWRQKRVNCGRRKNLVAKEKCSRQKRTTLRSLTDVPPPFPPLINFSKFFHPGHSYSTPHLPPTPPPIKFPVFFPSRTFSSVNIVVVQKTF